VNDIKNPYFPQGRFRGVQKSYKYWFTGENTAVLEYQETLNALFQLTLSGSDKEASNASKAAAKQTASLANIITYNYAPRSTESSQGAAGKENEAFFTAKLNSFLEEGPKTVILKSDVKEVKIQNVVRAEDISRPEDKSAKADVLLHTNTGNVPLSLKEDGPFRWASAMKTFREVLELFVQKGLEGDITGVKLVQDVNKPALLLMQDSKGNPYSKIYIVDFPLLEENLEYYLFGSDEAKVVQRSFTDNDFSEQDNTIIINCTNLFTETKEVPQEYLPIIRLERNATHATSTTNPTRRGIQLRIVPMFLKNEGERSNSLTLNWKTDILQK
jgi:hypothetical protein